MSDYNEKNSISTVTTTANGKSNVAVYERKTYTQKSYTQQFSDGSRMISGILVIVICILLLFNLFHVIKGDENRYYFSDLLELLSSESLPVANVSDLQWLNLTITDDWGVMNGLRDFFNMFAYAFEAIAFVDVGLYNTFVFVGYIFLFFLRV